MAKPVLIINDIDYTAYLKELKPTGNGLNADGSGRDVQTGEMFRTKIADKLSFEVSFNRIYEADQKPLNTALRREFYTATVLDPDTNERVGRQFYTDTRPFGSQRYDRSRKRTYYDGMAFTMTEK